MKKTLTSALCFVMLVTLLAGICGCITGLHGGITGAYFATVDDIVNYFEPETSSIYDCIRMPNDERFVESGYLCYNMYDINKYRPELKNDAVISIYKVNVDGKYVYVVLFIRYELLVNHQSSDIVYETLNEPIPLLNPLMIFDRDGDSYYFSYAEYKPDGFVKEIAEETMFTYEEFTESSRYFLLTQNEYIMGQIAIYDTRNVPQSEKEALASELMEILYNNYKLAGEKAE